MIDRELVIRKLVLIGTDLEALRTHARKPIEEYLRSDYDELAAERLLERLIGRMIDVNYHLIVESGEVPPRDYHASFVTLGKLSILPVEFAGRLSAAAGLRNRIVHQYDEIDPEKIHEALTRAVSDVPEYARHVRAFLDRGVSEE